MNEPRRGLVLPLVWLCYGLHCTSVNKLPVSVRAGFTYRVSRLKPRASEKMRGLITNNEDLFFFSVFINIFSEKATSADMKTFVLVFTDFWWKK